MLFTIITLFPENINSFFSTSIIGRAQKKGTIEIKALDLRQFGIGKHKTVDDKPYGGGTGMVLKVDVLDKAIEASRTGKGVEKVVLVDPKGEVFRQETAENLSEIDHLIIVAGHYEGYDERIRNLVDYEISIGDYVLSSGELAAMVITEAVARLVPGVLSKEEATLFESFSKSQDGRILEGPQYTRPPEYKGEKVPEILLTGDFKKIEEYRREEAKKITRKRRPDLTK